VPKAHFPGNFRIPQAAGIPLLMHKAPRNRRKICTAQRNAPPKMQEYISAHTSTVKVNADTTNAKLQSIISELSEIEKSIDANTNGDISNTNNIKKAIADLKLSVTNNHPITVNVPKN
jgi:hypothetical protein